MALLESSCRFSQSSVILVDLRAYAVLLAVSAEARHILRQKNSTDTIRTDEDNLSRRPYDRPGYSNGNR
jgi:hypothetical protein